MVIEVNIHYASVDSTISADSLYLIGNLFLELLKEIIWIISAQICDFV